jgi:hypothetical protein
MSARIISVPLLFERNLFEEKLKELKCPMRKRFDLLKNAKILNLYILCPNQAKFHNARHYSTIIANKE